MSAPAMLLSRMGPRGHTDWGEGAVAGLATKCAVAQLADAGQPRMRFSRSRRVGSRRQRRDRPSPAGAPFQPQEMRSRAQARPLHRGRPAQAGKAAAGANCGPATRQAITARQHPRAALVDHATKGRKQQRKQAPAKAQVNKVLSTGGAGGGARPQARRAPGHGLPPG